MAAKSKKFRKLRLISLIEAIIIMILCVALIWAVLIRGRGEEQTVPVSAELSSAAGNNEDEDPEVRTRAVIDKEETFYQLDGKKIPLWFQFEGVVLNGENNEVRSVLGKLQNITASKLEIEASRQQNML